MFDKKPCKKCGYEYDSIASNCPKCKTANDSQPDNFKPMTVVHFIKQIALFLTGWLGFKAIAIGFEYFLIWVNKVPWTQEAINKYLNNVQTSMIINAGVYGILIITLFLIMFKDSIKLFKSFKNYRAYAAAGVCLLAIFAFNFIYGNILNIAGVKITNNNNEQGLVSVTAVYPVASILVFGFIGPICEELTYRVGLFSCSRRVSKWLAYPLTIIVFTLIHFDFQATTITNELLNIPYYAFAAFALSFTYEKYGFAGSTTAHILNNVISLVLVRFVK